MLKYIKYLLLMIILVAVSGYSNENSPAYEVYAGDDYVAVICDGELYKYSFDGTMIGDSSYDEMQCEFLSFANDRSHMIAITNEGKLYIENPYSKDDFKIPDKETNLAYAHASSEIVEKFESLSDVKQLLSLYPLEYIVLHSSGEIESDPYTYVTDNHDNIKKISWTHGLTLLLTDGSLVCENYEYKLGDEYSRNDIREWRDIEDISVEGGLLVALGKDGKVYCEDKKLQSQTSDWDNICRIAYYNSVLIALDRDGKVYSAKGIYMYDCGQTEVGEWTDVVAIDTNGLYTVGVKKDGSILVCGAIK